MLKLEKKQVKFISIVIALVFIGSVVALALTQTGSGIASAAGSVSVGVVDRDTILNQHPDGKNFQAQMEAAYNEVKNDFESKSPGMSEQERQEYNIECQKRLVQKQQELMEPLLKSMDEAIKKVADTKGLSVVIEKAVVVYGGTDITQDVISRLNKK